MAHAGKFDLAFVRRMILARRSFAAKCGLTLLAILLPAVLRWCLDGGRAGFPFTTFYPFVVLAAVMLDWRFASVVAVSAGLISARFFPGAFTSQPLATRAVFAAVYLSASGMLVAIGSVLRNALAELQQANDSQALRAQELVHRFKNMVAVVNALALQTVRNSPPEEFHAVLAGRLDALVKAAELAMIDLSSCDIVALVNGAIAPFQVRNRIRAGGPSAALAGRNATALMLALHELATNAVKYGALSLPDGTITIDWAWSRDNHRVDLVWLERGGPPVTPPTTFGFGARLLETMPDAISVTRYFEPDGLRCEVGIKL